MRIHSLVAVSCLATAYASATRADTVTIQASKDNTLYEDQQGTLSNGAGRHFFAGDTLQGEARRALIAFDIAGMIPTGSQIDSAILTLHMSRSTSGPVDVLVHRLVADWGEGSSRASGNEGGGGAATNGDATWRHTFFNTSFWSTEGGDFLSTPSAATSVADIGFYTWSSPSLAGDVQTWLDSPISNFGWLLNTDELDIPSTKRFDSRQNPSANVRPTLTVNFTVPEPATAGLLAAAATFVFFWRRPMRSGS